MCAEQIKYPYDQTIVYENDKEYRKCIREIFRMVTNIPENSKGIDEVTLDENDHDQEVMRVFLDYIYEKTIHNDCLKQLYQDAAALMISEDCGIGLVILFSYDYFHMFHPILCEFFTKNEINQENPNVVKLEKKMKR